MPTRCIGSGRPRSTYLLEAHARMKDMKEFPSVQRLLDSQTPAERLPEAVEGLTAAIERGHHIALVAGEGARLCRLYAAAAIHDLAGDTPGRALVLVASPDRAHRLARSIERFGASLGWETVLWSPERAAAGGPVSDRALIIATPSRLLADVRSGDVSLTGLRLVALDDVASLQPEWAAVDGLLQASEGEIRRIAATHRRDKGFDQLVQQLLPRARKWPAEMFPVDDDEKRPLNGPPLRYAVAASHDARLARLAEMIHDWASGTDAGGATVWCDGPATTESIRSALAIEGFAIADGTTGDGVAVRDFSDASDGDAASAGHPGVAFGLPWSAAELSAALGGARLRAAIVSPRHVAQMEILGARAGWPVRPLPDAPRAHRGEIEAFRATIEEAIESRDLAGGALLIDPLIEKHGFDRVSAALATLFRETAVLEEPEPPKPQPERDERPARGIQTGPTSRDADRATRSTWSRVFINVGRQDGAAPGDFVGAITGETGAVGGQIGKIEIKEKFSLIDVDSMIVDEVLRGLNGKQIKSREVVAKLDRVG